MDFEKMLEQIMKNPEAAAIFIQPLIDRYMPVVRSAAGAIFKAGADMQEVYMESGWAAATAKARKAKYDAYVEAGFTEDQAMSLLLTDIRQVATLTKGNLSQSASAVAKAVSDA